MSIFTRNAMSTPKSSWFGMTHTNTLTLDMPYLTPVLCRDVIPGDKWKLSTEIFLRMMPMLSPIMTPVDVYCHYFYVPLRLLVHDYDQFFNPEEQDNVNRPFLTPSVFVSQIKTYMSNQGLLDDGEYKIDRTPTSRSDAEKLVWSLVSLWIESSLADYLGIPVLSFADYDDGSDPDWIVLNDFFSVLETMPKFSAFPFLMYQLVYDSFYRDQTLEESVLELLEQETEGLFKGKLDTEEPFAIIDLYGWKHLMGLRCRAWRKDYFTSALPTPQAGPDVHLPLTGDAPVVYDPSNDKPVLVKTREGALAPGSANTDNGTLLTGYADDTVPGGLMHYNEPQSQANYLNLDPNGTLKADMSSVTSATINELRRAVRAQEFLEKCARGGRRYIEMILSHFGVRSSDARLDRPEFLGGGRQPFTISEVLSHVGEDDTQNFVLGEMGGHGMSYGQSSYTKRFFEEHGFIFAIVSVLPKASYQQGLERMWTRENIFDYAWPSFANLGEQEIKNKEIYAQGGTPEGVFGYAPRYSEYKYIPSSTHGAMRSSLAFWHLGRIFASAPSLNADFVHPRPEELKRIFAIQEEGQNSILGIITHHCNVNRRLPKYGIPTL